MLKQVIATVTGCLLLVNLASCSDSSRVDNQTNLKESTDQSKELKVSRSMIEEFLKSCVEEKEKEKELETESLYRKCENEAIGKFKDALDVVKTVKETIEMMEKNEPQASEVDGGAQETDKPESQSLNQGEEREMVENPESTAEPHAPEPHAPKKPRAPEPHTSEKPPLEALFKSIKK